VEAGSISDPEPKSKTLECRMNFQSFVDSRCVRHYYRLEIRSAIVVALPVLFNLDIFSSLHDPHLSQDHAAYCVSDDDQ